MPHKKTVFVGRLSDDVTEQDVRQMFERFGAVVKCTVVRRASENGRGKCCAFVTFTRSEHAVTAVKWMHWWSSTTEGRASPLVVRLADSRRERKRRRLGRLQSRAEPDDDDVDALLSEMLQQIRLDAAAAAAKNNADLQQHLDQRQFLTRNDAVELNPELGHVNPYPTFTGYSQNLSTPPASVAKSAGDLYDYDSDLSTIADQSVSNPFVSALINSMAAKNADSQHLDQRQLLTNNKVELNPELGHVNPYPTFTGYSQNLSTPPASVAKSAGDLYDYDSDLSTIADQSVSNPFVSALINSMAAKNADPQHLDQRQLLTNNKVELNPELDHVKPYPTFTGYSQNLSTPPASVAKSAGDLYDYDSDLTTIADQSVSNPFVSALINSMAAKNADPQHLDQRQLLTNNKVELNPELDHVKPYPTFTGYSQNLSTPPASVAKSAGDLYDYDSDLTTIADQSVSNPFVSALINSMAAKNADPQHLDQRQLLTNNKVELNPELGHVNPYPTFTGYSQNLSTPPASVAKSAGDLYDYDSDLSTIADQSVSNPFVSALINSMAAKNADPQHLDQRQLLTNNKAQLNPGLGHFMPDPTFTGYSQNPSSPTPPASLANHPSAGDLYDFDHDLSTLADLSVGNRFVSSVMRQNLISLATLAAENPPDEPTESNGRSSLSGPAQHPGLWPSYAEHAAVTDPFTTMPQPLQAGSPSSYYMANKNNKNHRPYCPAGANLFVYNFPYTFKDIDLLLLFAPFGYVISAVVFYDKVTGHSKCYGFVSYDNVHSAQAAIQALDSSFVGERKMTVTVKTPKAASGSR